MNLTEKIKRGWDISAEGYSKRIVRDDFVAPGCDIWKDLILSKAPKEGKLNVLDVGTGPGVFATILSLTGHTVTGIDISPKMLEQARKNSAAWGVSPAYQVMNSQQVDFPENTFDLIVSRNVVWALEFPEQAYESWFRVLRPGGRVLVFDTGHSESGFLTKFDHNNEEYIAEYREKFGVEPPISFQPGQYEEARGWKRELKLTYEDRPSWDVHAMEQLGYQNVAWDNVAETASYTDALRFENNNRVFFRLWGDKAL